MIKSIIFDFDGVIHDTFDIGFSINKMLDPSLDHNSYKEIFMGNLYTHKSITPEKSKRFFEIAETSYRNLEIEKEIKEELLTLKKKFKLFIITSNKESILKRYFEDNNLNDLFDDILGMETHTSKIEKFNKLFKKYNLGKDESVFVTDTLGDILEANKVGIKTIAVDFGFHDTEVLKKGNPFAIVSDFLDISKEINKVY